MSTFDSTKASLNEILKDICNGKIQLPDFQRGWVWDDDHIKDLLVSIARSFPVGAVMMLETGGEVQFQTRPVEGAEPNINDWTEPEKLILDGQQRLTTLTQALAITTPVKTRTNKGKKIDRHYYFNIQAAIEAPHDLEGSIVAVDENRQVRSNFNRDIDLDLSSRAKECKEFHFPCDQIMNPSEWERELNVMLRNADDEEYRKTIETYHQFRDEIIESFKSYQLPVIQLQKQTSKEAVCLVFEKVNTGGVQLNVFELITASYAADGYNLRDDWFGSEERAVQSRHGRLAEDKLLAETESTEFLQAVTLLYTKKRKALDIAAGKTGKQVRPVSAKRADVLELPLSAWNELADKVEEGFIKVGSFLRQESFYSRKELPYSTQIVPLAAVLSEIGDKWREPKIYEKLSRWFWCGILGELYGGAVETRIALDYEQLLEWFEDDTKEPRTIGDASFQPERFNTLRSRLSAAYKGINTLILREGAQDWFWKAGITDLNYDEMALDIHHIFPKKWCKERGIPLQTYDNILNKTTISYKANRKIGGDAPSVYLEKIQNEPNVQLDDAGMNELLKSHAVDPGSMRADDFDGFVEARGKVLCRLIERAMGKGVLDGELDPE